MSAFSVSSTKDEGTILVPWLVSFFLKQVFFFLCIFCSKGLKVRFRETSYVSKCKV